MPMAKNALLCSLAVLVATGCTSGSGGKLQTAKPTPSLGCRLPVISPANQGVPPGGWITFPGGNFERDPASLPIRLQAHVPSYDRAIKAWLPVENRYVAPNGGSYILTGDASVPDPSAFYLVDVKSGTRRLVLRDGPPQAPGSWTVVDYATAGVYLWSAGIETVPGLWLLDPATGNVRLVDGSHYWWMEAGGVAWALDPQSPGAGVKQAVYRLDIASGRVERWYETDSAIYMLSPDSDGHVLVVIGDDSPPRLGLLTGPDKFQRLALPPDFPAVSDGYLRNPGVWLALRGGGLALYTATEGVRIMTRQTDIFDIAGGCW
jgi:hypothetical protein